MRIEVIEEGHPGGRDLVVMGKEARLNEIARANGVPQRHVAAMPIGEGYAVLGLTLEPMLSEDKESFCAVLTVVGGRQSDLVPMVPVKLVLGELARVSLTQLRERLATAIDGPREAQ
jgi:hypothetical protein